MYSTDKLPFAPCFLNVLVHFYRNFANVSSKNQTPQLSNHLESHSRKKRKRKKDTRAKYRRRGYMRGSSRPAISLRNHTLSPGFETLARVGAKRASAALAPELRLTTRIRRCQGAASGTYISSRLLAVPRLSQAPPCLKRALEPPLLRPWLESAQTVRLVPSESLESNQAWLSAFALRLKAIKLQ